MLNCSSIHSYNAYIRQTSVDVTPSPDGVASSSSPHWILSQKMVMTESVTIPQLDPYVSLSVGVSVVNNAQLESRIVETDQTAYIGSL